MYRSHVNCTTAEKNRDAVFDHFKYSMLEFCQQKAETLLMLFKRDGNFSAQ